MWMERGRCDPCPSCVLPAGECDGVFLSAVSNLGVRLPVAKIVRALKATGHLRFVVVDGAQELNHIPTDLSHEHCDSISPGHTSGWAGFIRWVWGSTAGGNHAG